MTWWQALLLGITEGLTEYLPVSSTGHVLLLQRALGLEAGEAAYAYAVCIQAGAILPVFGLYWSRVLQILRGLAGRDPEGWRLGRNLLLAFLPVLGVGGLEGVIKARLYGLWPVVSAWLVGGVALVGAAHWWRLKRPSCQGLSLPGLGMGSALLIGLMQCLAVWPGTSRSLVTILGGLLVGLSLDAALEFSFLLGGGTLLAAAIHDAYEHGPALAAAYSGWDSFFGFLAAALTAALAITWMVRFLRRRSLAVFGYYRVGLAAVVAALLSLGWLAP